MELRFGKYAWESGQNLILVKSNLLRVALMGLFLLAVVAGAYAFPLPLRAEEQARPIQWEENFEFLHRSKDEDLRFLLKLIFSLSGYEAQIDSDIQGTVNHYFNNYPLEGVFNYLSTTFQLGLEKKGPTTVRIFRQKPAGKDGIVTDPRLRKIDKTIKNIEVEIEKKRQRQRKLAELSRLQTELLIKEHQLRDSMAAPQPEGQPNADATAISAESRKIYERIRRIMNELELQ